MRRLTVLQVLPRLEEGGVERGTLEVGRALAAAGHRSLVASGGGRLVARLEAQGSEHLGLELGRKSPLTLGLVRPLRRLIASQGVDVVHARSRLPAWIAWLAWRGLDPGRRAAFVTTAHGLYSVNRYSAIMARGERVIAVSECVRRYLLESYPGIDPGRVVVIHRGVDPGEFPRGHRPDAGWLAGWRAAHPELAGRFVVTLAGRFTRLKGHADLLDALARLRAEGRPVHGLLVGGAGGSRRRYADEIRARAAAIGAPVTFAGPRDDLREVLAASDAVVSLSTHPESFGRTVVEALCLGVPVVGYDHGGVGEVLARLFPTGAVPVGDVAAVSATLAAWMEAPPRVPPCGDAFTLERMLARTLDLYEEVAAARRPSAGPGAGA